MSQYLPVLVLIVLSVRLYMVQNHNYGIDFRGGTMITAATPKSPMWPRSATRWETSG